jgi:hypothetical protein
MTFGNGRNLNSGGNLHYHVKLNIREEENIMKRETWTEQKRREFKSQSDALRAQLAALTISAGAVNREEDDIGWIKNLMVRMAWFAVGALAALVVGGIILRGI